MTGALDSVGKTLGREVGGLPVAAWAGIVGVGIFAGRKILAGRQGGGGGGGTATPFVDPNSTGYTASGEPATAGGGGGTVAIADNAAWRRAALDYLDGLRVSGVDAERAIGRYLTGEQLSTADRGLVNLAITALGAPPEGVPVPGDVTTTPTVPGTPGRSPRSTTVRAPFGVGENLNQVATRIRRSKALGGEGVTTTTTGAPLTAAYLASTNGLRVTLDRALAKGTRIAY